MSLKYMGVPDYCKHGNYEDTCVWCENARLKEENARLVKLLAEWVTHADAGKIDGVDLGAMVTSEELVEELRKAVEI